MSAALKHDDSQDDCTAVLQAVRDLKNIINEQREVIDQKRRLPTGLIHELKKAGVFRMAMPKAWGGLELSPIQQLQILETLARYDASVAWCATIGSESGFYSGFINQDTARSMYRDINSITASALVPTGRADMVGEGYIVQGRWPFVSCAHQADWFVLGCKVFKHNQQLFQDDGTPMTLQCYIPAEAVNVMDTWHSTGLRGSGSHDVSVPYCTVPKEQTFSYQNLSFYREGPLYSFPLNIALNLSAVPLGVAQRALEQFLESAAHPNKITHIKGYRRENPFLRDEAFVQHTVGKASATLNAVKHYLYSCIRECWSIIQKKEVMPTKRFAQFQMLNTYVYESCKEVVESLYKVRGDSPVFRHTPLDRSLSDLQAMDQHILNSVRSYAVGGRSILGLPSEMILR